MRTLLTCMILATAFNTTLAQDAGPTPKITAATSANVGDIIIIDAAESIADHFSWIVDSSGVRFPADGSGLSTKTVDQLMKLGWKPPATKSGRVEYMILEGGKKLILASYPGTWKVVLAVSNKDGVKQLAHTMTVTGGGTEPPDVPDDPDDPPDDPKLKTDFSAEAKTWLATVKRSSRDKKDSSGITVQENLHDTLVEIGNRWKKAGSIAVMETLLGVGIQATLTPLGAKAKDWQTFAVKSNEALDSVKSNGGTPEQYGAALLSIAKGLE